MSPWIVVEAGHGMENWFVFSFLIFILCPVNGMCVLVHNCIHIFNILRSIFILYFTVKNFEKVFHL